MAVVPRIKAAYLAPVRMKTLINLAIARSTVRSPRFAASMPSVISAMPAFGALQQRIARRQCRYSVARPTPASTCDAIDASARRPSTRAAASRITARVRPVMPSAFVTRRYKPRYETPLSRSDVCSARKPPRELETLPVFTLGPSGCSLCSSPAQGLMSAFISPAPLIAGRRDRQDRPPTAASTGSTPPRHTGAASRAPPEQRPGERGHQTGRRHGRHLTGPAAAHRQEHRAYHRRPGVALDLHRRPAPDPHRLRQPPPVRTEMEAMARLEEACDIRPAGVSNFSATADGDRARARRRTRNPVGHQPSSDQPVAPQDRDQRRTRDRTAASASP